MVKRHKNKALVVVTSQVEALYPLSGKEILDRIVEAPNPRELVQGLPHGDFYWLLKKVGESDCLPILEHASLNQWQYVLDMELWNMDRLDLDRAASWLSQLQEADPQRLARWFFAEGQPMAFYFFYRSMQVKIIEEEDTSDLSDDFFTLDGTYYIRVLNPEHREFMESLLRVMAAEKLPVYQSLLLGLAGVLPAEAEEQLYRMRNVRLAEYGFLPFEEAVSVYSPLNPEKFQNRELPAGGVTKNRDEMPKELVPVSPFFHLERDNVLVSITNDFADPFMRDRIHLEFAGLCNQILSADGVMINDLDVLVRTCRKAAGYVNLSLEKMCHGDMNRARELLEGHPLVSLFRLGFGLILKLKWEITRWIGSAWFADRGLDLGFWGDVWGETIRGLLFEKPLLYRGDREERQYRDFHGLAELHECREILHDVIAMDSLFKSLSSRVPFPEEGGGDENLTFHPFLFNLWARNLLGLPLSFKGITIERARTLFSRLRAGEEVFPYHMPGFEQVFVSNLLSLAAVHDEDQGGRVKKTLSYVWQSFREEYEYVSLADLESRFSRFITIVIAPEAALP